LAGGSAGGWVVEPGKRGRMKCGNSGVVLGVREMFFLIAKSMSGMSIVSSVAIYVS